MRGKAKDHDFISSFVSECVERNLVTPQEIAAEARLNIKSIDDQIRTVERLKLDRAKYLEIANTFDPNSKHDAAPPAESGTMPIANRVATMVEDSAEDTVDQQIFNILSQEGPQTINNLVAKLSNVTKENLFLSIKKMLQSKQLICDSSKYLSIPEQKTA